jgi:hypothetical protein
MDKKLVSLQVSLQMLLIAIWVAMFGIGCYLIFSALSYGFDVVKCKSSGQCELTPPSKQNLVMSVKTAEETFYDCEYLKVKLDGWALNAAEYAKYPGVDMSLQFYGKYGQSFSIEVFPKVQGNGMFEMLALTSAFHDEAKKSSAMRVSDVTATLTQTMFYIDIPADKTSGFVMVTIKKGRMYLINTAYLQESEEGKRAAHEFVESIVYKG